MIRHIVAWNFKDGQTEEEHLKNAAAIKEKLEGLSRIIPGVISLQVITNPASTGNRSIVLSSLFETEADLAAYQINPAHDLVSAFVGSVTKDRVCLDLPE